MDLQLQYKPNQSTGAVEIVLPGSKSISNRYLILNALAGFKTELPGLSESRDTQLLQAALLGNENSVWFEDGATPIRFFLAYAAATGRICSVNGTAGLQARPIAPLVAALKSIGGDFEYLQEPDKIPIAITKAVSKTSHIQIDRSSSSQFASAILLIAPMLSQRLSINFLGQSNSEPYVQMTLKCMEKFGITHRNNPENGEVIIDSSHFQATGPIIIDKDWSSASYFYSLCACIPNSKYTFPNLHFSGYQGDENLADFYASLGIKTTVEKDQITIENTGEIYGNLQFQLSDNPDLAPAIICTCAYLHLPASFYGLQNLKWKESDRIAALNQNLNAFGVQIVEENKSWFLQYSDVKLPESIAIDAFSDHRIAMALSVFALGTTLRFSESDCVAKSFPDFWNALAKCNFVIQHSGTEHTR